MFFETRFKDLLESVNYLAFIWCRYQGRDWGELVEIFLSLFNLPENGKLKSALETPEIKSFLESMPPNPTSNFVPSALVLPPPP